MQGEQISTQENQRTKRKDATRTIIEAAIEEAQTAGGRLTIAAVARKAGVSPPLIHNTYPDLAAKIREINGRIYRTRRAQSGTIEDIRGTKQELVAENARLAQSVARLESMMQLIFCELGELKNCDPGVFEDRVNAAMATKSFLTAEGFLGSPFVLSAGDGAAAASA